MREIAPARWHTPGDFEARTYGRRRGCSPPTTLRRRRAPARRRPALRPTAEGCAAARPGRRRRPWPPPPRRTRAHARADPNGRTPVQAPGPCAIAAAPSLSAAVPCSPGPAASAGSRSPSLARVPARPERGPSGRDPGRAPTVRPPVPACGDDVIALRPLSTWPVSERRVRVRVRTRPPRGSRPVRRPLAPAPPAAPGGLRSGEGRGGTFTRGQGPDTRPARTEARSTARLLAGRRRR